MRVSLRVAIAVIASLGFVGEARATPNFPDELQSHFGLTSLPASPPCLLCHTNPAGGIGTATTPFGTFLRSRGLQAYDVAALDNALDADRAEQHDSDGNGISDYDDLRAGRNPNGAGDASDQEMPSYGCVQSTNIASAHDASWLALFVATAWLVRCRRGRRD